MLRFCWIFILLLWATSVQFGRAIRCYECSSELDFVQYDACLYGDKRFLHSVMCHEPSVCAAYHYRTDMRGSFSPRLSISRGCQALRFGATCEDIFNDLRRRGQVLPGQHICTTCSEDLCNHSGQFSILPLLLVASATTCLTMY